MKAKEIIKQLKLENGLKSKHQKELMLNALQVELENILISYNGADDARKFENAVKEVRSKWDGIYRKIPYGIPEELWGYFYKAYIIPLRDKYMPELSKRLNDEFEARKRRSEEREEKAKNVGRVKSDYWDDEDW